MQKRQSKQSHDIHDQKQQIYNECLLYCAIFSFFLKRFQGFSARFECMLVTYFPISSCLYYLTFNATAAKLNLAQINKTAHIKSEYSDCPTKFRK